MTAEIKHLIRNLNAQPQFIESQSRRAAILNMTNPHTGTITLHRTDIGNISIKTLSIDITTSSCIRFLDKLSYLHLRNSLSKFSSTP